MFSECNELQHVTLAKGMSWSAIQLCCALLPTAGEPRSDLSRWNFGNGDIENGEQNMSPTRARYAADSLSESTDVFLPSLNSLTLELSEVDFEEKPVGHNKPFQEILTTMLERRKALGSAIERLSLVRCNVQDDLVKALKGIVAEVELDGGESG